MALTRVLGDAATLDLRARFGTAAAALEGDKAIRDGRKLLLVLLAGMAQAVPRPAPDTLRWLNDAKAAVERAQIRWAGAEVQARLTVPGVTARAPAFAALAAQSVKRARSLGTRVAAADNLKQIGRALHDYHEAFGALPGAAIYSADGKTPLLS